MKVKRREEFRRRIVVIAVLLNWGGAGRGGFSFFPFSFFFYKLSRVELSWLMNVEKERKKESVL